MKTLLAICLVLVLRISNVMSQSQTLLYNNKGQLLVDTSLTITKDQLETWRMSEGNIIAGLTTTEFPPVYLENKIKPKGILIASFICDSASIREIKVLNDSSGFSIAIIKTLQHMSTSIARQLTREGYNKGGKYLGKYYVAFNFDIIDLDDALRKHKAVPVIKSSVPLIDKGIY